MEKISIIVNDTKIEVRKESSILEAAQDAGIYIPRLCAHPDLPSSLVTKPVEAIYRSDMQIKNDNSVSSSQEHEGCQLCVVKIEGENNFTRSCSTPIEEGMEIWTETSEIQDYRLEKLSNILANHPHACLTCAQREGCAREPCSMNVPVEERCCPELGRCELQKISEYIGIPENTLRYKPTGLPVLEDEPLFRRNYELCVNCTRCVRVCSEVRDVGALGFIYSKRDTIVGSLASTLKESGCKFCGACVEVCPTGALTDKDIVWAEREKVLVPCRDTCPLEADVPRYIHLIAEGKFGEAAAVVREKTPFPSVLGRVCFHTCENECRRGQLNDPIAICALKRFALEHDTGAWKEKIQLKTATEKKVAVVGAGPAGLTAAYYLSRAGHSVTVFESGSSTGGMLVAGIPGYRLPREILQEDLEHVLIAGVKIKTDTTVGKNLTLDDLKSRGHAAIFVSIGAQQSKKLNIPGMEIEGVLWGVEFLKSANLGQDVKVTDRVLVIGGGNVAIDVALTALRLGAKEVQLACLESREEMPAHEWEIQDAIDEQVTINCSWGPKRIQGKDGRLSGIELVQCTSVFDENGNFKPVFDETVTKSIETEMVILAIGQSPDLSVLGTESQVTTTSQGLIQVTEGNLSTLVPGIFAGGEVTRSPLSVVEAINMGRKAASSIDKYLGGTGNIDEILSELEESNPVLGRDEGFYDKNRVQMPCMPPETRTGSFDAIELGYDESMAVEEAKRCLRCDLRLFISPVVLPPEKWLELTSENIQAVPETEGAFQLLDGNKQVILIQGTLNLHETLYDQLENNQRAKYFDYHEDPMYTKRESELLQQFMQEYGRMPEGNEDLDDDLF
ncbi:MAG: FAD-dependent oxidoreductase [Candidatus Hodarchaeales archaeon]|jgi:NADPH-dependent glutamate synthase beta subunit-like oxidoreductase/Pyruvate/2-oxoacid:ferredoxin oxidoreductase delta subunit